jgi:hypothetical protein
MAPDERSTHPVDRLIRDLVETGRPARPEERERITERIATAPFEPRNVRVPPRERDLVFLGRTLDASTDSLFLHLVRRVVIDGQWAAGTTTDEYLADLRSAVRAPRTRLALYRRRGGYLAAALTPSEAAVAPARRGPRFLPWLLVVYSADHGIIVTGYQASDLAVVAIPEDAQWLS